MQGSGHVSIVGYYSGVNRYLRALGSFIVIFAEAVLYDRDSSPRMYKRAWTRSVKCHAGMLNMLPVCMSMFVGQQVGLMKDCQPSDMLGIPLLTMGESNMRSTIHTTSRHEHGMQTWTLANMSSFGPETPFLLAVLGPGE